MNKENCMSYITSPNYMFKLILPKCNMVLGSYLTSVYFQIFLNICHDQTIELWKYNKCWLSQETISKNIKCARLTVNKMIGYLEQLQLIKKGKHLRHNTYELINNKLNEKQLENFNRNLEVQLLNIANDMGKDIVKIQNKFNELELEIAYHKKSIFKFVKNIKFSNTNKIRNIIKSIEQDNNGITIFYINNVLNPNKLKQKYRALRSGISQASVCQYKKYCMEKNLINMEEIKMQKNHITVCPICRKALTTKASTALHLSKTKEENHQRLYELYKQDKNKDLKDIYEENKDLFTKIEPSYKNVKCESCNGNCRLCYKEWKEEFNECNNERKRLFIKQEQKFINFVDEQVKKEKRKKKINPNSSPNLLKYFYDKVNKTSPGFARECKQIKNLLDKKYTPDQIRLTMDYLIKRKNIDLRYLNRSIEDAIIEDKYTKDIKIKDSASYLVKLFHSKLNVNLNIFNFIGEVNKIQSVLDEGYTPLQVKQTIKYMQNKNCKIINFLPNMIEEAIEFYNNNNNNSFLENDLKYNLTNLEIIDIKYKNEAIKKAKEIFKDKSYFKEYTKFEWAYLIKLDLNKELIEDGIEDKKNNNWFFNKNFVQYKENEFFDWLKKQFKNNNIKYIF